MRIGFGQNTNDPIVEALGNTPYRMHRFRSNASPIKGLTSDILVRLILPSTPYECKVVPALTSDVQIRIAEIAYGKPTVYERWATGQLRDFAEVVKAIDKHSKTSHK